MSEEKRQLPLWQESLLLVATALVLALIAKTFFFQAFYIPSESMMPTMVVDDKILVQKVSFWSGSPQRGDVVVFADPGGWLESEDSNEAHNAVQRVLSAVGLLPTGGHLIKRVVGVGGDTVRCCDDSGRLTVNDEPIDEAYVLDPAVIKDREFTVEVKPGHLWAMGDNRGNSEDSVAHLGDRGGGQIPTDRVVGKAWVRVWPFNRGGFVDGTDAFAHVPEP